MRRVLVLFVVAVMSGCSTTTPPLEGPASSPSVVATPSPESTPEPAPDPFDVLPTGPPPRLAYAVGGVIVHPDGGREPLVGQRRIGVTAFTRFRHGWIVADARFFEGTVGLAYVAGRRRTHLGPCASGGAKLSDDGRLAAWMTQFCPESGLMAPTLVHVGSVTADDDDQHEISRTGIVGVAGFVGDEVVVSGNVDGVDLVGPDGSERSVPHLRHALDARGDLVAGLLPGGDSFGAVVDAVTGRLAWKRRHTYPELFSPDGTHIAGYAGRRPVLLDAETGHVVALLLAPRLALSSWAWEDDRHLLASATFGDREAMVRVDLTGRVTRIGPVTETEPLGVAFETRP